MPTLIHRFILCLLLVWATLAANAKNIQSIGVPYIQNYTKLMYQSGNQNWSITKDKEGVMHFGNAEGLLSFDGKYWRLNKMPNNLIVRAVAADSTGRVYAGGFGEFGYWAYDKKGIYTYNSLIPLLDPSQVPQDEIWKIYVDGKRVLFQSFSALYIYENNKFHVIKAEQPFLFLHKAGKRFFIEVISKGLYELIGHELSFIPNSADLALTNVLSVLPYRDGAYLIGTSNQGIFLYDGKQSFSSWNNQANGMLKSAQINNGALVLGNYYAFGTILNGLYILDEEGNLIQHINKSSGLQNNTVLSVYADNELNLWTGLDNGIDRVEVNSSLYFYFDKVGRFGTVYSSIIHDNKIYLGTNQGLFYSEWSGRHANYFQSLDFKLIEKSQGQVWDLSLIDGQLLCGHNEGTFRVVGNTIQQISDVKGGWVIKKLKSNPAYLIQGTYTGLALYKKDKAGNWVLSHKIEGFGEPSRYVEQDNTGQLWISHAYQGLYQLNLSEDLQTVRKVKNYDKLHGLPGNRNVNVFNLDNQIVFSSDSGFYIYDNISDRFSIYSQLNKKLGYFASANKVIKAAGRQYWFIDHGKVALMDLAEPGKVKINTRQFSMLNGRMVQYYENISHIGNAFYLISIDDGFVIFNNDAPQVSKAALPSVLIRKIENTTHGFNVLSEHTPSDEAFEVPHDKNDLRFSFALPYYSQAEVKYQYLLEGHTQAWSAWTPDTQKEFTNLGQGDYRFKVRAQVNGEVLSPVTEVAFRVLAPWYAGRLAMFVYAVVALLLVVLLRKAYQVKLQRDQVRIQQKLEKEQEEILTQEAMISEQKIARLRNEQLQAELASKSRELANTALHIVSKNELLLNIKEEVLQLKDVAGKKLPEESLKKIQKIINEGMGNEQDWNLYEKSFDEAHENYFKKLKAGHPDLTPNDLKLCAYLHMNMNSKEIATLLNITVRAVEIRRYRLRKKLNLEHDKNLVAFLMEL